MAQQIFFFGDFFVAVTFASLDDANFGGRNGGFLRRKKHEKKRKQQLDEILDSIIACVDYCFY